MATAARAVMTKRIHRTPAKIVTEYGGRVLGPEEATVVRLVASKRIAEQNEVERAKRRLARVNEMPIERQSVARAMLFVEIRFVKALWVLERALSAEGAMGHSSRNGLDYFHDRLEQFANAVANGGWHVAAPRPPVPQAKEIDEANKCKDWLRYLEPTEARVLTIGAMMKKGDVGRRINWMRVKGRLPEFYEYTDRRLRGIYSSALRNIVAEQAFETLRD